MRLKVTTVGNSTGVVLPKDLLAKLRVGKGDSLYAMAINARLQSSSNCLLSLMAYALKQAIGTC